MSRFKNFSELLPMICRNFGVHMKEKLFFSVVASVVFLSCNSNELTAPGSNGDPYQNVYSGNYFGLFIEENNGVDSNGVFKDSTAYDYTLEIHDEQNQMVGFSKGNLNFDSIVVDETDSFVGLHIETKTYTDSLGNSAIRKDTTEVKGYFTSTDSVYVFFHSLGGGYLPTPYFTLTHLTFSGKKIL